MVFNFGWAPQLFGANRAGGRKHAGIDLGTAGRKGVPVGCPISGFKVHSVSYRRGYGNTVDLISEDGTKMMRFAHLAQLPKHLKIGAPIQHGDWLGDVGNTGGNYAIHLHFEYRTLENGQFKPINPFKNPYHTFSKNDFEYSTRIAQESRKHIRAGVDLATAQSYTLSQSNTQNHSPAILANLNSGAVSTQQIPAIGAGPISHLFTPINNITNIPNINDVSHIPNINNSTNITNNQIPDIKNPYFKNINTSNLTNLNEQINSFWTLEKTFEEPTWWERFMPVGLGGWTNEKIEAADIQKRLDEEVFKGIRRKEMIEAGLSDQDVDLLRQFVDDQIKEKGVNYRLNASSVQINFEDVFTDPKTVEIAKNFFNNRNDPSSNMG